MRRRRLLILTDVFGGLHGGTEGQILTLVRDLPAGWEAELWVLQHSYHLGPNDFLCPWRVWHLPSVFDPRFAWRLDRVAQAARAARFDLIQAFHSDTCWLAPGLGKRIGVPVLTSRRDMGYWQRSFHLPLLRAANRVAAGIVANAQAVATRTIEVEHAHPSRVHVIPNGHVAPRFDAAADAGLRTRLGIPEDAFLVGLCANLRPLKRHEDLVDAVAAMGDGPRATHGLVLGTGEDDEVAALQKRAHDRGLDGRFHLHGVTGDVVPWLKALDVGVLCSESEGLSNALIEYLACGLPIVATNVGGNPDLVDEGRTGHLYPVGDVPALVGHLVRLRDDGAHRAALGAAGRERFRTTLTAERMVASFVARFDAEVERARAPWRPRGWSVAVHRDEGGAGAALERAATWLDGRGFFLSPAWITTWWQVRGGRPCVVEVFDETGALQGVLPLLEARGVLGFAGQDSGADHLDVIAAPGRGERVASVALDALVRRPLGALRLRHLRHDGALRAALHDPRHGLSWNERFVTVCHEIDTHGTFDEYLGRHFSRKRRHELRRTVKRALERPGARIERATNAAEADALLTRLFALHRRRFTGRGMETAFAGAGVVAFHRALARRLVERGELVLLALSDEGRDLAVYYGFRFRGRVLHFQSGVEDGEAGVSAGSVLRAVMLEQEAFGHGAEAFDFLDGDESYKHAWSTGRRALFDVSVHPRGARGRFASAVRGAVAVAKDEIRRRRSVR